MSRDCDDCSIFFYPAGGSSRADLASFPMYVILNYLSALILEERQIERNLLEDYYLNIASFIYSSLVTTSMDVCSFSR